MTQLKTETTLLLVATSFFFFFKVADKSKFVKRKNMFNNSKLRE